MSFLILKENETPAFQTLFSVPATGLVLLEISLGPLAMTEQFTAWTNSLTRDNLQNGSQKSLYFLL